MKKTVTVKGEKLKVNFNSRVISRDVVIKNERYENTWEFVIDGKPYIVNSISTIGKKLFSKLSTRFIYKGVTFPDSEKKVIEYILSNK